MLMADFRYALRTLRRAPVFTAAAVLTLALGIGVNASMFTVLNSELLRPLPFAGAGRLVRVAERNDKLHLPDWTTSVLNYLSWKEKATSLERMGAVGYTSFALTGLGDPQQFAGNTITPELLALLGMHPVAGREFREEEEKPGSAHVAMLGETLWRRRFSSDSGVAGRKITLNDEVYTIVGVIPAELTIVANGDIFAPLIVDPLKENRLNHLITAVARLKPGFELGQAQADLDNVSAQLGQEHPEVKDWGVRLVTFGDWFVPRPLRTALFVLMGAVVLVLCIACVNVASLLLARATARQQEVAVRVALGASRADLFRQFLVESLLLAACGGVLGVPLAATAVQGMIAWLPTGLLPIPDLRIDAPVLLFTAVVTLLTSMAFGLAPLGTPRAPIRKRFETGRPFLHTGARAPAPHPGGRRTRSGDRSPDRRRPAARNASAPAAGPAGFRSVPSADLPVVAASRALSQSGALVGAVPAVDRSVGSAARSGCGRGFERRAVRCGRLHTNAHRARGAFFASAGAILAHRLARSQSGFPQRDEDPHRKRPLFLYAGFRQRTRGSGREPANRCFLLGPGESAGPRDSRSGLGQGFHGDRRGRRGAQHCVDGRNAVAVFFFDAAALAHHGRSGADA